MNSDRIKMILEMLESHPQDPFLRYAAALEYKKHQQFETSKQLLIENCQLHPDYLASYYQLGKILEQLQDFESALTYYKLGLQVAKSQQETKAIAELSEAILQLEDN